MVELNFEQNLILKKVLVAPLDWGLGHATRCIPIIKQLQSAGCTVTVAASGKTLALLAAEFPGISTTPLFGYNISYTVQKRYLPLKILLQSPKIMLTIWREHIWIKKIIKSNSFQLVISDNRFGLYTNKMPCIFITHQLLIKASAVWLEHLIQFINYLFINNFNACWVPDFEAGKTMAAELSHPKIMPALPVKYIGPLSRFSHIKNSTKKYKWLVILSGPEPQRSLLENKILAVAKSLGPFLLLRGKPGEDERIETPENVTVANHLSTKEMQSAFEESEFVISRCGYTTVMEVLALQKKAILIPTPGQTEQEYLAKHLFTQQWCYCCSQDEDLLRHFKLAETFEYKLPTLNASTLEDVVRKTV
jgi:uncharacterized protein (TIGR00661 family)